MVTMTTDRLINQILLDKPNKSPLAVECIDHTINRVMKHPVFNEGRRAGWTVIAKSVHQMMPKRFESTGLRKLTVVNEILDVMVNADLLVKEIDYDGRTRDWTRTKKTPTKIYLRRTRRQR